MDREKVIKGLECLAQKHEQTANPCSKCDYHDRPNFAFCVVDVATDALALLKEQETKDTGHSRVFQCEKCGYGIDDIFLSTVEKKYPIVPKYCPNCGRSVNLG